MASQEQYKEITDKVAELLKDLLATGNWEASLFLRTAYKKIYELYEEALFLSAQLGKSTAPEFEKIHQEKLNQGLVLVYISLYQSDPLNLTKWENTLKSIREYTITRPVYAQQDHVEEAIRSKQGAINEGFVTVYIKKEDIIPAYVGKKVEDRWGHELLTIRDGSLLPSNILEFVHQGKKYEFKNGKLSLKSNSR